MDVFWILTAAFILQIHTLGALISQVTSTLSNDQQGVTLLRSDWMQAT